MSRMIPSIISKETKSNAEKAIFEWFRDDPTTTNWIVFHSLDLANNPSVIKGESDFIVLAPGYGIFALEVKGGRVSRDINGIWHFIDKHGKDTSKARGPFSQASDACFSIQKFIKEKGGSELASCLFHYGVMFPDIIFDEQSPEWDTKQIFDHRNGLSVGLFIRLLSKHTQSRWLAANRPDDPTAVFPKKKLPTSEQIRTIADILRPVFDLSPCLSAGVEYAEKKLISLTEEEYDALDNIDDSPRILFLGSAGTGKTLVALEAARRSYLNNIGLICYNSNLATWLIQESERQGFSDKLGFVGTFHSLIVSNIKKAGLSLSGIDWQNPNVYSEELIVKFFDSLDISPISFSTLIVDEAQDLFSDDYLDVFDSILVNGLQHGMFYFFGDFDNQSIYHEPITEKQAVKRLQERRVSLSHFRFIRNCRNTIEICNEITAVTGIQYKKILQGVKSNVKVDHRVFEDQKDEADKLRNLLYSLKIEFDPTDIVVLSPRKREESCASLIPELPDFRIPRGKTACFSTIQAFKGLESKVVLLTDIKEYSEGSLKNSLIYVGLSRARSLLVVFETDKAKKQRLNRIWGD